MATVILDTGILEQPELNVGQATGTNTVVPIERQIYPSANNEQSLVSVRPGTMVVVTTYGNAFAVGTAPIARVYKVLLAEPIETKVVDTCGLTPMVAEVSVIAEANICDNDMYKCTPMTVLKTPGVYRIIAMDSDLTITAVAHPL